jgi:hypothetical protein
MGCHTNKTIGSEAVINTGIYTDPGAGSFIHTQGYYVLYDRYGRKCDWKFHVFCGKKPIAYVNATETPSYPSGIQRLNIAGGAGSFLNAQGIIILDADNVTEKQRGDHEVFFMNEMKKVKMTLDFPWNQRKE